MRRSASRIERLRASSQRWSSARLSDCAGSGCSAASAFSRHPSSSNATYLRVSTPQQDVSSQRLAILEYARTHDIRIDDFIEATASGQASEKRRRLDELTSVLQRGDRLVVSELSRLGRSLGQIVTILDALAKAGVAFVALKENIRVEGKRDIQTKVMTTLFALFAEVERDLISERTREGLARARASGRKLGRPKGSLGVSRLDGKEDEIRRFLTPGGRDPRGGVPRRAARPRLHRFLLPHRLQGLGQFFELSSRHLQPQRMRGAPLQVVERSCGDTTRFRRRRGADGAGESRPRRGLLVRGRRRGMCGFDALGQTPGLPAPHRRQRRGGRARRRPTGTRCRDRYIEALEVLEAVQQPICVGGIAAQLELPEPDEPRHAGVGPSLRAHARGRAEAPAGPTRRCALRSGAPCSTSASAQSRSIVVVAGRMVRVPRQASTNLRARSSFDCACSASSRSRSTSSRAAPPEKDRNPYRRRSSARWSCRVADRTA